VSLLSYRPLTVRPPARARAREQSRNALAMRAPTRSGSVWLALSKLVCASDMRAEFWLAPQNIRR